MNRWGTSVAYRVALGLLILRIAVPPGLMPSAIDDGWLLEICPDGIVFETSGADHSHHQHHQTHHQHGEADSLSYTECELGAGIGTPAAVDQSVASLPEFEAANFRLPQQPALRQLTQLATNPARGPPSLT